MSTDRKKNKVVEFDSRSYSFRNVRNVGRMSLNVLGFLLLTLCVAIVAYVLFALFFNTDTERMLRSEIRSYERLYPDLEERVELITDAVAAMQYKDNRIYETVFRTTAPELDPIGRLDFLYASDTIPDKRLNSYVLEKTDRLFASMNEVDAAFADIFAVLTDDSFVLPPMQLPVKDVSYPQTGASLGSRLDPYYGAYTWHEGIDFIVTIGSSVYATADGVVTKATSSRKYGNSIEISHAGGYKTVYAHLESLKVGVGQRVTAGQVIGSVGTSGRSYAPHLHYEVRLDGEPLDPVHYFFASVSPYEYSNMLYMSVKTRQSMD